MKIDKYTIREHDTGDIAGHAFDIYSAEETAERLSYYDEFIAKIKKENEYDIYDEKDNIVISKKTWCN